MLRAKDTHFGSHQPKTIKIAEISQDILKRDKRENEKRTRVASEFNDEQKQSYQRRQNQRDGQKCV